MTPKRICIRLLSRLRISHLFEHQDLARRQRVEPSVDVLQCRAGGTARQAAVFVAPGVEGYQLESRVQRRRVRSLEHQSASAQRFAQLERVGRDQAR